MMNQTNETNEAKECCTCNECYEAFTDCDHEIELCCVCHGHEWIALDKGETIECAHCDADITLDELEAMHE